VADLSARVSRRESRNSVYGYIGFGLQYDDNRGAFPTSGTFLIFDTPISSTGKNDDFAFLGFGKVGVQREMGLKKKHSIYAEASFNVNEQVDLNQLDIFSITLEAGGVFSTSFVDIVPFTKFTHLKLGSESYFKGYGFGLELAKDLNSDTTIAIFGSIFQENFSNIANATTSNLRTGERYDFGFQVRYWLASKLFSVIRVRRDIKNARVGHFSFRANQVNARLTWVPTKKDFVSLRYAFRDENYLTADPSISAIVRDDKIHSISISYGHKIFKKVNMIFSFHHLIAKSNIPNFSFNNNKFRIRFIYSF
jgi:hypothetical protein